MHTLSPLSPPSTLQAPPYPKPNHTARRHQPLSLTAKPSVTQNNFLSFAIFTSRHPFLLPPQTNPATSLIPHHYPAGANPTQQQTIT